MTPPVSTSDLLRIVMRGFDAVIAITLSSFFLQSLSGISGIEGQQYPLLILFGSLLLPAVGEMFGLYQPWRGRSIFNMFGAFIVSWLATVLLISVFLVVTKTGFLYSRLWMGLSGISVLLVGLILRGLLYLYLRHLRAGGHNLKSVLFIGRPENIHQVRQRLASMPFVGYRIDRIIADKNEQDMLDEVRRLADNSAFKRDFDEVWISYPLSSGNTVKSLADALISVPVEVRYFPDMSDVRLLNHRIAQVADMFSIDLNYSPLRGPARLAKSLEDRVLGLLIFIGFLPLMLIVALLVLCCMGRPILFKQYRHGLDGKRFRIYKFRTMHLHDNGKRTTQAYYGDARITRLGAFLRRTSLDETPQFYNVLQGRMSLVGPRPHAMDHNEHYKDLIVPYMQRHRVKPGITGWAQVHGLRGITDDVDAMRQRIEYDLYYINNWSLGLDLKILMLTLTRGFVNEKP